jgi:hypothetical protein
VTSPQTDLAAIAGLADDSASSAILLRMHTSFVTLKPLRVRVRFWTSFELLLLLITYFHPKVGPVRPPRACQPPHLPGRTVGAMASSKATPALNLPSDVSILKTKEAAKHGLDASVGETEVVWPKPEFVSEQASRASSTHIRPHCDTSPSKHPTLIRLTRVVLL